MTAYRLSNLVVAQNSRQWSRSITSLRHRQRRPLQCERIFTIVWIYLKRNHVVWQWEQLSKQNFCRRWHALFRTSRGIKILSTFSCPWLPTLRPGDCWLNISRTIMTRYVIVWCAEPTEPHEWGCIIIAVQATRGELPIVFAGEGEPEQYDLGAYALTDG